MRDKLIGRDEGTHRLSATVECVQSDRRTSQRRVCYGRDEIQHHGQRIHDHGHRYVVSGVLNTPLHVYMFLPSSFFIVAKVLSC
jgi:hypothetical protein